MKKLLSMMLAIMMLATMALGMVPASAEGEATTATAWLLYFASNHEKDQNNFPWWPQHTRADHPASETGVEATNAVITGPGNYTVGLKFNWQKAEGAIQFNLIINDAERLFPGYYVDITDIRVNGQSIAKNENYYGTYHDDTNAGMVPLYNSYWDPFFSPDAQGPQGYRSFDGTPEDATHMVINPDDIVNGDTIEVDFIFAKEAGAAPEELGAMPEAGVELVAPAAEDVPPSVEAKLHYVSGGWWPTTDGSLGVSSTVDITGEGYYTLNATMLDQGGWTPQGNGVNKLMLIVADGNTAGSVMDGMYLGISDIRINGKSIEVGNVAYGPTGYSDGALFDADDEYAIIFDEWMIANQPEGPWGHETWDGSVGSVGAINPDDLVNVTKIEVDFFVTATQGKVPAMVEENTDVWYNSNTVGLAGLSLKDLGIAEDWHNIVPVDLTKTGWQVFTLVGADAHVIGNAFVAVNNGAVSVSFKYAGGPTAMIVEHSECIKWFTDLEAITAEELASIEGGLTSADAINVQTDLGGADVAYLSINNKVSFRSPIDAEGNNLPRYFRNTPTWVSYREQLKAMLPADAE